MDLHFRMFFVSFKEVTYSVFANFPDFLSGRCPNYFIAISLNKNGVFIH